MNTYLYEVTYKKNNEQTYTEVRDTSKENAFEIVNKNIGDITLVGVTLMGN